MLFTEPSFLAFFSLTFGIYWAVKNNTARKAFLTAASLIFYSAWDWRFLALLLGSALWSWLAARFVNAASGTSRRGFVTAVGVALHLTILATFKYFNFFMDGLLELGSAFQLQLDPVTLSIILPIGISFYTFHGISYIVDVHRRRLAPHRLLDVMLYIVFFPQLVAGPIVRGQHFLPQLASQRLWRDVPWRACLLLFVIGVFKKVVVADNLATLADPVFANPALYSHFSLFLATVFFGIQIYCDFSGYTDMALAVSGLLGYRLMANFDAPYLASNIVDFWRRWHISLSFWLRDYLYIPLGGNRFGTAWTALSVMTTMLLGGLWHGAAVNFVIWGALHGTMLVVYRFGLRPVLRYLPLPPFLGTAALLWCVFFAWVFFRSPDLESALIVLRGYVFPASLQGENINLAYVLAIPVLLLLHCSARRLQPVLLAEKIGPIKYAFWIGTTVGLIILLQASVPAPFLYFQF